MLEDDGRIDEKIFNEYTSLSLRYPPRFTQVSTCEEALAQLSTVPFDLIICMPGTGDNDSFDVARHIKGLYEHILSIRRQRQMCIRDSVRTYPHGDTDSFQSRHHQAYCQ